MSVSLKIVLTDYASFPPIEKTVQLFVSPLPILLTVLSCAIMGKINIKGVWWTLESVEAKKIEDMRKEVAQKNYLCKNKCFWRMWYNIYKKTEEDKPMD